MAMKTTNQVGDGSKIATYCNEILMIHHDPRLIGAGAW